MFIKSLKFILPAAVFAAMVTLSAVSGLVRYGHQRDFLLADLSHSLTRQRSDYDASLTRIFQDMSRDLTVRARSGVPAEALRKLGFFFRGIPQDDVAQLRDTYTTQNPNPPGQRKLLVDANDGSPYGATHAQVHPYFLSMQEEHGYYDLMLVDTQGNVLYTTEKEADFATNLRGPDMRDTGLARAFERAMLVRPGTTVFQDFAPYAPSHDSYAGFLATPVMDAAGKLSGVLVAQLSTAIFTELTTNADGTPLHDGAQGDHFQIIGADGKLRFSAGSAAAIGQPAPLSDALTRANAGETGLVMDMATDDHGHQAASFSRIDVLGTAWVTIAAVDHRQAFAALGAEVAFSVTEFAVSVVLAAGISLLIGRGVIVPLERLTGAMKRMAGHDYDSPIPNMARRDEIGTMARILDAFRAQLAIARVTERDAAFKGAAFDAAPAAMMIADANGQLMFANAAMRDLWQHHGAHLAGVIPKLDRTNLGSLNITHLAEAAGLGKLAPPTPDDPPQTIEIASAGLRFAATLTAVCDQGGADVGQTASWAEVSDQRRGEGIIAAIQSNQPMFELAPDGRVLRTNDVARSLIGAAALGDAELSNLFDPTLLDHGPDGATELHARLTRDGHAQARLTLPRKTGDAVVLDAMFNLVRNRDGSPFGIIAIGNDISDAVARQNAFDARRAALAAEQAQVVGELGRALLALAEGDLACRIDQTFPPDYEAVRENFNTAVAGLETAITQVVSTAINIRSGAAEMSEAADDLSRRTESQAATLEQTAAALDELTASVKSAADGAGQADQTVQDARGQAENSGQVMLNAVGAMGEIEKSSRQISQIIGVIDDIAFQTNLLALNAGVEAARAGEAGRGFAVVASEVRALAQRSSDAAREIKGLITASTRQVETGVTLVGQTGDALRAIVGGVTQISGLVSNLARSSAEQASGIVEINAGVSMLDQVTQQNAAMVEQTSAASHALRREAEGLAALVARFHLGTDLAAPIPQERSAARAPQDTPPRDRALMPRGTAVHAHQPRPARRNGTDAEWQQDLAGATALKPAAGWEDF